jgi:predicted Ser/Thr protein kinase
MRSAANCPDVQLLEQLMLGQLSDTEAERLEDHLAECTRCGRLADHLPARGPLVEAMRVPSPILNESETPAVERLIGRLGGLRPADITPRDTPGGAVTGSPEGEDLLEPPREPGEIGRIGGYRVVQVLGSGGMGVVYQAWQQRPKRLVALKMSRTRQRLDRLLSETEIVARLQHPHIVPVYEVGEHNGLPYFTMEFLEGGSLAQKLTAAPLAGREVAELVETLARAVQFANDRGFVHRDLKPANVLLTRDGVPKIGDFGLARQFEPDPDCPSPGYRTESGAILGTPSYMAPEQAAGQTKDAGPAADVWALGAILYECLTGRPPFQAASVLETLELVRSQDPVLPTRLQPKAPRDLETICLECLQKEPSRRYAAAGELADDLRRFLDGKPIRARPASLWERIWKWARRRPALAALAAVSGLSALVLTGGVLLHNARLRAAMQKAEDSQQRFARNYQAARDTLNRMMDRLENRPVGESPQLKELQR